MPVQIDYENEIFNILESFNIEGDTESVVKNLRLKFDGIKGKKSRFKARNEEKINHLIKERAPWLAKKNFISLLIFNFLKNFLRFDETIYADYIQDLSKLKRLIG